MLTIALILGVWVAVSVLFCVALARAAVSRSSDAAVSVIEVSAAEDISFAPAVANATLPSVPAVA